MKRLFSLFLALTILLSMTACAGSGAASSAGASSDEAVSAAESVAAETSAAETETPAQAAETTSAPKNAEPADSAAEETAPAEEAESDPEAASAAPGTSELIGTYQMTGMDDGETSEEELAKMMSLGISFLLTLNEDGTGALELFGESETLTWDDSHLYSNDEPIDFTYDNGSLVLSKDGTSMTFVKLTEEELEEIRSNPSDMAALIGALIEQAANQADDESDSNPDDSDGKASSAQPSASAPGAAYAAGDVGDYHVEIVGAESFTDGDDKDGIRFYYDFTNNSDSAASAFVKLDFEANQEGYELVSTWALDDVPEDGNDLLDVRPGVTIRCISEYNFKPDGGTLTFTLSDFWGDGGTISAEFDPQNLPGRPTSDWAITPIPEPDWTAGLQPEGDFDSYHVKIKEVGGGTNYAGEPIVRIYYDFTNNSDSPTSFLLAATPQVMQDGIQLSTTFTMEDIPEEDNYSEDVNPGETITVARAFALRTDSPVTVELVDWRGNGVGIGTTIPIAD